MSTSKRDICLNALLHPQDKDCRRVSNFLFIGDDKKQKEEIISYLKDYNQNNCYKLDSYIEKVEKDEPFYFSLRSEFLKKIKKSKIGIRESSLFVMTEYIFFLSYGLACRECLYVEPLPAIPGDYNESQTNAMEYVREGYCKDKKTGAGYYFERNIENGAIYLAMRIPVNMHHNGKYKTEKKVSKRVLPTCCKNHE